MEFSQTSKIIEYKARLSGISIVYVDAKGTSSLCPICGAKLSLNGHGTLKCKKCGLMLIETL
nr:zinc ribbon domain-containing protein [Candidatus Baldrarchaeota archaeon]